MNELNDQSPMPFGKFKGKPMQDVPASYLHWLWQNGLKSETGKPVHEYVKANLDALKQEDPDRIWD